MTLPDDLRRALRIPVVAAPMTAVTGPESVAAAMRAGIMGVLPRHNAASLEEFTAWVEWIRTAGTQRPDTDVAAHPLGPLAVNLSTSRPPHVLLPEMRVCREYGIDTIITAMGDPTAMVAVAHEQGLRVFHDVTELRFAEKAARAGVDGMTCIVAGGGGHSGLLSPFVFVPSVRRLFDGTILMAGGIASGDAVRSAELLGADLAYVGTRFIATDESRADPAYKAMIVDASAKDLVYTPAISAVPANWMTASLRSVGLDPDDLPVSPGRGDYSHLPPDTRPWRDLWSAGQSVQLIDSVESTAEVVDRLEIEYRRACAVPEWPRPTAAVQTVTPI